MTTELSNRAIVAALVSVHGEIARFRMALAAPHVSEEQWQDDGEALLELERAYGDLRTVYLSRRTGDASLPALAELVGGAHNDS
jgi:hypothetical protein